MVMRERVTIVVVLVLLAVGGWFASSVRRTGLEAETGSLLLHAAIAISVLTAIFAGIAAATTGNKGRVDERDHRIAARSQMIRGAFYLCLSFGVLGILIGNGHWSLVNAMFLSILAIEIISGVIMLTLYRFSA